MSKYSCEIMHDLLPLYADGVCSDESRKAVTEHLSGCEECRKMMEKYSQKVAVSAEHDISALRKIKKRIRLGKIAALTAGIILLIGGLFCGYIWAVTDVSMDYDKYNIAENVWVEEDSSGELWLCKKGTAAALSSFVHPTISDTDGGHMGYEGQSFDQNKKCGFGVTLKMFRIARLVPWNINSYEERIKVRNDLDYVFYYDDASGQEYVLWGEKPE